MHQLIRKRARSLYNVGINNWEGIEYSPKIKFLQPRIIFKLNIQHHWAARRKFDVETSHLTWLKKTAKKSGSAALTRKDDHIFFGYLFHVLTVVEIVSWNLE